ASVQPMTKLGMVGILLGLAVAGLAVAACSGGDDGDGEPQDVCKALCARTISCPNDPDVECEADCKSFMTDCKAETTAYAECGLAQPDSNLECDEEGETSPKDGVCEAEAGALGACLAAAAAATG